MSERSTDQAIHQASHRARRRVPIAIAIGTLTVLGVGVGLTMRANAGIDQVALSSLPKPVTVVVAGAASFRATRRYVGTLEPWVTAHVGPQFVSAYVDTVLVRPGSVVRRGAVLATLDCRNVSATDRMVGLQARAIAARQRAIADETARTRALSDRGFVSSNELELKNAQSSAEEAQLAATQANVARSSLEVNDCVLRAPFSGEVATRDVDPGAFVRPGTALCTLVDRDTVRYTADAPEVDFPVVAPGRRVRIRVLATGQDVIGTIARRAPSAHLASRTVRFEVDLPDRDHVIPVNTTGDAIIEVGDVLPAVAVPANAASVRGSRATVFVVKDHVARPQVVELVGEQGGTLFLGPALAAGSQVVTEGRTLLKAGDLVDETLATARAALAPAARDPKSEASPGSETPETLVKSAKSAKSEPAP